MLEPGLGDPLAIPQDIVFTPPPSSPQLKLRAILAGVPTKSGLLLLQFGRFVCVACLLGLLLPALLVVGVFALLVAQVLGVPLFAPSHIRIRLRPRS